MLERMLDHGLLWRRVRFVLFDRLIISLLIVITAPFACEISWTFVFVCAAIVLETCDSLMNVAGRELVKLLVVAKDNDGDIDGAEYTQLVSLLEQAAFSLQEGDRAIPVVFDRADFNFSSAHAVEFARVKSVDCDLRLQKWKRSRSLFSLQAMILD